MDNLQKWALNNNAFFHKGTNKTLNCNGLAYTTVHPNITQPHNTVLFVLEPNGTYTLWSYTQEKFITYQTLPAMAEIEHHLS